MKTPFSRNVERQAVRMGEMIQRLDVDPFVLAYLREGDGYEEARMTCFDCSNTARCLKWLNASAPNAEPPTFCPNLSLFEFCKREA
jgi:hypothetical protein